MQKHLCIILAGACQSNPTDLSRLSLLDNKKKEAGLDTDTNDLPKQASPSSENAELAFKNITGPRLKLALVYFVSTFNSI